MDERESRFGDELDEMNTDIEGALLDGLDDDPRLGHGVPSHLRGTDLDFIQMSGLTVTSDEPEADHAEPEDMDPSVPVSFYEEGVDDVDSRRAPLGTEPEAGSADEVIVPRTRTGMSSSIQSLKEIVADLTSRESVSRSAPQESTSPAPSPPIPAETGDPDVSADGSGESDDSAPDIAPVEDSAAPMIEEPGSMDAPPVEIAADDEDAYEDIVVPDDDPVVVEPEFSEPRSPLSDLGPLPEIDPEPHVAPMPPPVTPAPVERAAKPPAEAVPAAKKPDLAQAESLLQRLEAQAGRNVESEEDDLGVPEIPEATVPDPEAAESDESVYNRPNAPARKYSSKRRRARRRLARLVGAVVLLAALGVGGYIGYGFVQEQAATDTDHYRSAMRLIERGRYAEAGSAFAAFTSRYPDSALLGDALLMAAHAHEQLGESAKAVTYYERFRSAHPDHPKVHRATTLLALAQVRAGAYDDAIALLQNPDRRTLDPDGYLASLRALGEAHAALGQIDEARSAYLRAASLEGNYTADEDYLALATLYQAQAESAAHAEARRRYLSLAVDQWDFAMRSPGLTESRRREIKVRRDLTISELGRIALGTEPFEPGPVESMVAPVKPDSAAADDPTRAGVEGVVPDGAAEGAAWTEDEQDEQAQLTYVD